MEEPELPGEKPYFMLVIQTFADLKVTQLVLKGPKLPIANESPTIGYYYKDGKYILKIGGGDKAIDPTELSSELKAFFDGANSKGVTGPNPIRMPNKSDLKRSDGTYKSFESYQLEVRLREYDSTKGVKMYSSRFPKLPRELYQELIRHYLAEDGSPLAFYA